jgi:Cu/Ag efflux pump CusA
MGEIVFLALSSDDAHRKTDVEGRAAQRLEARGLADNLLRRRPFSVPGVSQVIPSGGDVRQVQVLLRPQSLVAYAVSFEDVAAALPFLGRSFLPEFNEGSLTVNAMTLPGMSLAMSDRLGRRVEQALLSFPEVKSTTSLRFGVTSTASTNAP